MKNFLILICTLLLPFAAAAQSTSHAAGSTIHHKAVAKKKATLPAVTKPTAIIQTTAGDLTCTLSPDKAPDSVANFVGLATGTKEWHDPKTGKNALHKPLYDGTIFHRVIPNFMIQGGDPLGTGTGGPGYEMKDEISPDLNFDSPGMLAYANSGPNTNGSQFFITELPTPWLNGHYTIFGQCDDKAVALVKDIARRARDERNDRPNDPVVIKKILILGYKHAAPARRIIHKKPLTHKAAAAH